MNPNRLGFGTGSNLLGGSAPLAQNMAAQAPALNQQSPVSPGFTPGQQVNPYPPLQGGGMNILPPQGSPPPGMAKPTLPKTEQQLIVEALSNRLKSISDLEHKLHDALHPAPTGGGK